MHQPAEQETGDLGLQEAGLAIKEEPYTLRVPRSQRGGEVIEPLVREQWFVAMRPLAEPALKVRGHSPDPPTLGRQAEAGGSMRLLAEPALQGKAMPTPRSFRAWQTPRGGCEHRNAETACPSSRMAARIWHVHGRAVGPLTHRMQTV